MLKKLILMINYLNMKDLNLKFLIEEYDYYVIDNLFD
jgi:hypothetical protein